MTNPRRRIKPVGVERTDGQKQWILSHDQAFAIDAAFARGWGAVAKKNSPKQDGECSFGTAESLVNKGLATWAARNRRQFKLTNQGKKVAR